MRGHLCPFEVGGGGDAIGELGFRDQASRLCASFFDSFKAKKESIQLWNFIPSRSSYTVLPWTVRYSNIIARYDCKISADHRYKYGKNSIYNKYFFSFSFFLLFLLMFTCVCHLYGISIILALEKDQEATI